MKKVGIFGCKSTTLFLIKSLIDKIRIEYVITISPEQGKKNQVADYTDLRYYCNKHEINIYHAKQYSLATQEDKNFFLKSGLDIGFVIGWQRLIPKEILELFTIGIFGMHGSADDLPIGRGRSPMNWALIEQRKHFFTNLFKYDPGVDSGDIVDTFCFSIQSSDTAETLHYKNMLAMKTLILKNMDALLTGKINLKKQRQLQPTYYPKRTPKDSLIDWRQDIFQIESFIRAVTKPFNGSFSYIENRKVTIWRASIFETDLVNYGYTEERWGTIVEVFPNGKFLVKCRGGLLIIHEFETEVNIEKGMILVSPVEQIRHFQLNEYGYHDL
jgi:methionyl-tRNA formyltransferase